MNKKQAIEQAMANLPLADSLSIMNEAARIIALSQENKRENAYCDSLSAKNQKLVMNPITTLNQLTIPIIREIQWSTASEFLGEEFWISLKTRNEKLIAAEVYNKIKLRMLRGMA